MRGKGAKGKAKKVCGEKRVEKLSDGEEQMRTVESELEELENEAATREGEQIGELLF